LKDDKRSKRLPPFKTQALCFYFSTFIPFWSFHLFSRILASDDDLDVSPFLKCELFQSLSFAYKLSKENEVAPDNCGSFCRFSRYLNRIFNLHATKIVSQTATSARRQCFSIEGLLAGSFNDFFSDAANNVCTDQAEKDLENRFIQLGLSASTVKAWHVALKNM
jgi:hypothetical protein